MLQRKPPLAKTREIPSLEQWNKPPLLPYREIDLTTYLMKYDRSPFLLRITIAFGALLLTVCGCASTNTVKLTSDPKLLEQLLDETTRNPASIRMVDDSVYTHEAYRVTVRMDTLEWFEHDTEWYAAGLNDVASVTISEPKPLEGAMGGAVVGSIGGLALGTYVLYASTNDDSGEPREYIAQDLTSEEVGDALGVFAALGFIAGVIDGVIHPPDHESVYKVEHNRNSAALR